MKVWWMGSGGGLSELGEVDLYIIWDRLGNLVLLFVYLGGYRRCVQAVGLGE